MATVVTNIQTTQGTYETTFLYTVYASFSGIQGEIESAIVQMVVPEWLNLSLEGLSKAVKGVTQVPADNGRMVRFDLGAMGNGGVSISFGFGVQFQRGIPTGTQYQGTVQLWVNGELADESASEPITLSVTPRFVVTQERILPVENPAPESRVYYRVTVENQGELGGVVENLTITTWGETGFLMDETFPIEGKDGSQGAFVDQSQDGRMGTIVDNRVQFTLPRYQGQRYQFIYRGTLSSAVGNQLMLTLSYAGADISQQENFTVLSVGGQTFLGILNLSAPRFSLPLSPIGYTLKLENIGNQGLEIVSLRQEIPPDIIPTALVTAGFHIAALAQDVAQTYELFYTTQWGRSGTLGVYNTQTPQRISLENLVEEGDALVSFTLTLPMLDVGVSTRSGFFLDGLVKGETPLGTEVTKADTMTWVQSSATAKKNTQIANTCALLPVASVAPSGTVTKIGDTLRYTIGANCAQSQLISPVFAALLPKELSYQGNVTMSYKGYFSQSSPLVPTATVEKIGSETLISFGFTGENKYTFLQKDNISISFDTVVNVGALGDFQVAPLVRTTESEAHYPSGVSQVWVENVVYGSRRAQWKSVLFFASLSCEKKVKGTLDERYVTAPGRGQCVEGGSATYLLTVSNNGNAILDSVGVVDCLPHVGDSGVIATQVPRESEFSVCLAGEVVVAVFPQGEIAHLTIAYAPGYDPVRFGPSFDTIGTQDNWQTGVPKSFGAVGAIAVSTENKPLHPGETLAVGLPITVPVGTAAGQTAWNSVAVTATYTNPQGVKTDLLAVEGEKVGLDVVASIYPGRIEGGVFLGDVGLQDVGVVLYHEIQGILAVTFTGLDGQYLFANLPLGQYRLGFVVDGMRLELLSPQTIQTIDLKGTYICNALVVARNPIDDLLMVNQSARRMLRTVLGNQLLLTEKLEETIGATHLHSQANGAKSS